jgi:UDP-N-acetyl-2-amino-2-deoxyglucuronate dehydrogenase
VKNLKVAIIGCGRISGHHCRSISETEGADLVAVCDLDITKADLYRDQFGAKSYSNYHKMFDENPNINIVVIATPSGMHYEHALEIISRYKKNIVSSLRKRLTTPRPKTMRIILRPKSYSRKISSRR